MNILLTNDDGYNYEGILLLKDKLEKYGNVYIVAPLTVMSCKSTAITVGVPVTVKKINEKVYAIDGTPADCVSFGLSMLGVDFDLVVSGCNNGWNISLDVMHSGTCGACFQAMTFNKKSIAFSSENGDFRTADKYFDEVFQMVLDKDLLFTDMFLDINFPLGEDIKGIKFTPLFYRYERTYFKEVDEGQYRAYRTIGKLEDAPKDCDWSLVENGYVTITPLGQTPYHDDLLKRVKKLIK